MDGDRDRAGSEQRPAPVHSGNRPSLRLSHERLASFFVMGLYIAGIVLTSLLIIQVLTWGLLSSFGHFRMMGLLLSFASVGLLLSRLAAGRYGNRLASRYMPRVLPKAVSARKLMRDFSLSSPKELNAFLLLHKLRVYSSGTPKNADTADDLPCMLEPLFTHNMYLPMTRAFFIRTHRLWFDAGEVETLIATEKQRILSL
jgi:hypothetical protein